MQGKLRTFVLPPQHIRHNKELICAGEALQDARSKRVGTADKAKEK